MEYTEKFQSNMGIFWFSFNDQSLTKISFSKATKIKLAPKKHPLKLKIQKELREYFAGERRKFTLPLSYHGTEFQKLAWNVLSTIPYGKTISYSQQAEQLGDVKKTRAVGMANGKNPLPIIIPCHRVIAKNGKLQGFAGGLHIKKYLLDLEQK